MRMKGGSGRLLMEKAPKTAAEHSPGTMPTAERERLKWKRRQRKGLKCRQMREEGVKEEEVKRKEERRQPVLNNWMNNTTMSQE